MAALGVGLSAAALSAAEGDGKKQPAVKSSPVVVTPGKLPQDHDYQKRLRAYLATLTEADFAITPKPPSELPKTVSADLAYRAWALTSDGGYSGPAVGDVHVPPALFTLAQIESGSQVLLPPVIPCNYAWLATTDLPFNPYRGDKALKRREFVLNAVDLMMHDQLHEADPKGKANRSDFLGGTLIWLGWNYGVCKDVIPPDARAAYEAGLKKLVKRLDEWGPRRSMTDMDLFAPVSLHYCAEATGDPEIKAIAERYTRDMFADRRMFDPAGYFVDSGIFDASYNGISLYFSAWAGHATKSAQIRDALAKAYRLKGYLCLPEPDGTLVGPTHFSPRTSGDSAHDQWGWRFRDCAAAMLTNEALASARPPTPDELTQAPQVLHNAFATAMNRPKKEMKSTPWGERHWTSRPFFGDLYYQPGFIDRIRKLQEDKSPAVVLPFRRPDNFVTAFDDRFIIAKRPTYGAVLYTGPVSKDNATFKRPQGFGGGALSAFWTPKTGAVVLGRRRGIQGATWDRLDEWSLWPTHAVSAITADGKFTTSARIQTPEIKSKVGTDTAEVTARGDLPTSNLEQGMVLTGKVGYERRFDLTDAGLAVRTELKSDGVDRFREIQEVIPIYLQNGIEPPKSGPVKVLYRTGNAWSPLPADRTVATKSLRVERFAGAISIELDRERPVRLSPKDWTDGYMSSATCRNILIELLPPSGGKSFEKVDVAYRIAAAPAKE